MLTESLDRNELSLNEENVPLKSMRSRYFILFIGLILLLAQLAVRDLDDRYNRPINGDAKGYYAYLPALFVYNDPTFAFIHGIEKKYYPSDGSQFKDFLNEQPNGRQVNKTFPGITIGYAPFFGIAWVVSKVFNYQMDAYSLPFQWSLVVAHLAFVLVGLYFLVRSLKLYELKRNVIQWLSLGVVFGTNTWYYVVYDQSVSHVFNFMCVAIFLFAISKWLKSSRLDFLGIALLFIAILVISRPTNALIILFVPLLVKLNKLSFSGFMRLCSAAFQMRLLIYSVLAALILFYPFILWKWQTGYWLVYSYNEEGFQFLQPHFWQFLFSYQKGWFVWSPLVACGLIATLFSLNRVNRWLVLLFYLPLIGVIYVFSSWWCWTYGAGFGQRPMIEFLPVIVLVVGLFVSANKMTLLGLTVILPLSFLSAFQGFQIANSIEIGGETTRKSYWDHFLQWKKDEPRVELLDGLSIMRAEQWDGTFKIDKRHPFSPSIKIPVDSGNCTLVFSVLMAGEHHDTSTRIVCTSRSGWYYSRFVGEDLYSDDFRKLTYSIPFQTIKSDTIDVYVWNGSTDQQSKLKELSIQSWK